MREAGWRAMRWLGVALVLGLVALAYLNPHMARDLANQLWTCF